MDITTTNGLSAREKYRLKKEEAVQAIVDAPVAEGEQTFVRTAPSGMEFTLRRGGLEVFRAAGVLPGNLSVKAQLASAARDQDEAEEVYASMGVKGVLASIEFNGLLVRYVCVDPKIVETPTANNELGYDDLTAADMAFLLEWAQGGGGQASKGLENFPVVGNGQPEDRPDSKGRGKKAKRSAGANGQGDGTGLRSSDGGPDAEVGQRPAGVSGEAVGV